LCPFSGCGNVARLACRDWHGKQFVVGCDERHEAVTQPGTDRRELMDVLYLLVPLSVVLVFFVIGGIWWAIYRGQFDDIDQEGERILKD
jgi:cbb3-type cytochrome oxidase maturation protein